MHPRSGHNRLRNFQLTLPVTVLLGPTYTFDSYRHHLKHITKWDSILISEEGTQVGLQIPLGRTVVDFRVFVQLSSASSSFLASSRQVPSNTHSDSHWLFLQLAISAWLVSHFNKHHNYSGTSERDRVRFLLFSSIWTVVFGALYMVLFWHSASGSVATSVLSHGILWASRIFSSMTGSRTDPLWWCSSACSLRGYSGRLVPLLSLLVLVEGWTAGTYPKLAIAPKSEPGLRPFVVPASTQNTFVYCGQLNALEGFAWVIWYANIFQNIVWDRGV